MPRDPDDVAVTMHGSFTLKESGICTINVTFWRPVPPSRKVRYSSPATFPSPSVSLPVRSTFGPKSTP
jgi:hypothetical protein